MRGERGEVNVVWRSRCLFERVVYKFGIKSSEVEMACRRRSRWGRGAVPCKPGRTLAASGDAEDCEPVDALEAVSARLKGARAEKMA